ncbi:MAG: HpcH/HpaI aldolase/citrate lyase family protein [Solirubrobacterales bacterium]
MAVVGPPAATVPRAALFVPADRPDRHAKAFAAGADAVIVDLEDAVAPARKEEGRAALAETLPDREGPAQVLLRINSPLTGLGRADLDAARDLRPDAIVVPKADIDSLAIAAEAGLPLVALIEGPAALLDAQRIATHPAVAFLFLGPIDLGAELGVTESPDGNELLFARGQIVLAAAAAGKPGPLDGPCLATDDPGALALEIARARRLGFAGKCCIHPSQVDAVTAGFSPSGEEVEWSRRVLAASEAAEGGVTTLDGRMIDRPVVVRARAILADDERNDQR